MNEFELKFEIPAQSLPKIVAAVHAKNAQLQLLQACYFDTEDAALAKNGLTLRMRKEGNEWVQTAKGLTSNALERLEHNVEVGSIQTNAIETKVSSLKTASNTLSSHMPSINVLRHGEEKIGKLLIKALKIKSNGLMSALIPIYETDVQRLKFTVKQAGSFIEIALDQGMVISGGRSAALCELEIELKHGAPEHAAALARTWCAKYGLWLSTINKSMKGQRLHDGLPLSQLKLKDLENKPKLKSDANGQQMVKAVFQSCLNQICANASEIASGNQSSEPIHELRVGIRRLRTAMRELSVLVDGINPAWEKPLIDAFRILGAQRDDDYLNHVIQPQMVTAGGPVLSIQPNVAKHLNASLAIRSKAFQDTLLCLIAYVNSRYLEGPSAIDADNVTNQVKENDKHKNVRKILANRLDKLHHKIIKEGKKFLTLTETQQHSVRKRFKRLRYLAEFSAPLLSTSSSEKKRTLAFIAALKPVQDALGFYNDELMALQTYRTLAAKDARAWFGAGWLSARRKSNAKKCQQEIDIFIKKTCQKNQSKLRTTTI
ncbi:MAG: CHAD domain-containing protein [Bdellovibrio sp.]|nr:CHAD domain-containing protein [Methylotenera sp.]